ncbi:MAG: hybrid sensor histidine kinase/response regulator [bacterium]|nr:hybrid sensor histidine kinase/response regulator [bacterium]
MSTDVLLVDDEVNILSILTETLEVSGFQVHACESGDEALPYLEAHQPALLLTDLKMPGINGMDLLSKARKCSPDTQVVILTGYGDMKSAVEALRLGAYDYLSKPVDMERLIQTLRNGIERRRLLLENRSLLHSLEETNRLKTEFIHGMSHEVRTPLGHILGFCQILHATLENLTDKQVRYLENIQGGAQRLLSMFEDMMRFSTLKSGDLRVEPTQFALADFLQTSLGPFRPIATDKQIELICESPATASTIIADVDICGKALELLLDNAIKFTPANGTVTLSGKIGPMPTLPDTAGTHPASKARWLHIAVTDTGPGVAPDDQERIFNLFEQGDGGLDRGHEGTGLGLALARSLAHAHDGDITLQSEPPNGSTFCLFIPLSDTT